MNVPTITAPNRPLRFGLGAGPVDISKAKEAKEEVVKEVMNAFSKVAEPAFDMKTLETKEQLKAELDFKEKAVLCYVEHLKRGRDLEGTRQIVLKSLRNETYIWSGVHCVRVSGQTGRMKKKLKSLDGNNLNLLNMKLIEN